MEPTFKPTEPTHPTPRPEPVPRLSHNLAVEQPDASHEEEKRIEYKVLTLSNYQEVAQDEQSMVPPGYTDDESLRAMYINRTEEVIDRVVRAKPDMILFLDKSARPVAWMMREFWSVFVPNEPMPEMKFVNIDSAEWTHRSPDDPRPTDEEVDAVVIPEEAKDELRDIFTSKTTNPDPTEVVESNQSEVPSGENTYFDGRKVLIIDEISTTGTTLRFAERVIRETFPEVEEVETTAWMRGEHFERRGYKYTREIPVWYHKSREEGRMVGDIDRSQSFWLSRRFDAPDPLSVQLRQEIRQLAEDVRSGAQEIIPDDPANEERYRGMTIRQAKVDTTERRPLYEPRRSQNPR